jgi:hypothetical protein
MPTTIVERQWPLTAVADCRVANIGAGNGFEIKLPPNAMLLDLTVDTVAEFNGTTNTLTVGDGTTTFANAVDVKTAGRETVANIGKFYPSGGTIAVTLAQTGTADAGRAIVRVGYVILGRSNETQT